MRILGLLELSLVRMPVALKSEFDLKLFLYDLKCFKTMIFISFSNWVVGGWVETPIGVMMEEDDEK
jgi:hypothetical protein